MKNYQGVLGAFLVGVAIFGLFSYVVTLKEKHRLSTELNQAKAQLGAFENQKQNLLQELEKEKISREKLLKTNTRLKGQLQASIERFNRLSREYAQTSRRLNESEGRVSSLSKEKAVLKENLAKANQEKLLPPPSVSLPEEPKEEAVKPERRRRWGFFGLARSSDRLEAKGASEGNGGFLVKDGAPTSSEKVKIEVTPAVN